MEKKFYTICYSKWRFIAIFILYVVTLVPITVFFLKFGLTGQIIIGFLVISGAILALFIIPRRISRAVLLISFDLEGLQFEWIKPYWGVKPKHPQHVSLNELKSYKYESSYNFSTLKLRLKSGSRIQLHRWYNDNNDDFDKFMTQFKNTIESYNRKKSTTTVIEKEMLIMENKTFLIAIGVVIGVIFITTIFLLIINGVSNVKGILPILIFLIPLIWVVIQIRKGLQS